MRSRPRGCGVSTHYSQGTPRMNPQRERQDGPGIAPDYDAIVIGAGISGMYQLYRLRELGLRVRVFETGSDVGGTWYGNRYPGARFDSESYSYGYSFSQELLDEWHWVEHFSPQPETLRYLNFVADKFDLRRDIQFHSRVTAAHWQENPRCWDVALEDGRHHTARFLITAIGPLSAPTLPRIEGIETFQGQSCHTARWPHEPVSFKDKRVAVIGTGATGVQTIQEVAKTAAHLTGVPAHAKLVRPAAQQPHRRRGDSRDQIPLPRHLPTVPGNLRLFPAHARPAAHLRRQPRRTRGFMGTPVCQPRLRHVAGQLS